MSGRPSGFGILAQAFRAGLSAGKEVEWEDGSRQAG